MYVLVLSAFSSFLPIHLDANGIPIGEISIILSIATITPYILFPVLIGVISDKYGRKLPTLIGIILVSFGFYYFSNITTFAQFFIYTFIIYVHQ